MKCIACALVLSAAALACAANVEGIGQSAALGDTVAGAVVYRLPFPEPSSIAFVWLAAVALLRRR